MDPHTYINKQPHLAPSQIDKSEESSCWATSIRSSKVKCGASNKRFGPGRHDHGLICAIFQSRMRCPRRELKKDFSSLSFGKYRHESELTKEFNCEVLEAFKANLCAKDPDENWTSLREAVKGATDVLPREPRFGTGNPGNHQSTP